MEDTDGFGARQQLVGILVVERDRGKKLDVDAAPFHQGDGGLQHRQGLQAKEIEFHKAGLLHPFHVELSDRHIRLRIAIEGTSSDSGLSPITMPAA